MPILRRTRRASLLLALALALASLPLAAKDTLEQVLERIRIQETRHFSYNETRRMQLLAEPWQASGDLYISTQYMVIAQHSPKPVTTRITAERMLHVDTELGLRRSVPLQQPFAVPGMEPFMQLLYGTGGDSSLEQDYVITHESGGQGWMLQLVPRTPAAHGIARMQVYGTGGHGPDRLLLEHEDGDRTEWQLSLLSRGETAARELRQVLADQ